MAGRASGNKMRQKIVNGLAPSSRADSSYSIGIRLKNCRIMKMPNGVAAVGRIMPQ
ncbi:hypothetical protein D9M70_630480 [compost metagenome]